jgi:D-alanyl-D-alanine carboxypeptidase
MTGWAGRLVALLPLLVVFLLLASGQAEARRASATAPAKDAALIIDGSTGKVLYARHATAERFPASLTKMMTLYLLFDALKHGKLTMNSPLSVSRHASQQKPTKLYLKPGQTITVDEAIRAIVIRSANDVAVVIAEALGGTESHFAVMMTKQARQMGMMDTNFHNASGLPDPLQITTAHDLAILARHLCYDFPEYYKYFSLPGFTYKGTWYPTHDNLIGKYAGADGLKTGFTDASGFNLVSSVVRDKTHIIGVVMGGRTARSRDGEMERLLDQTFAKIDKDPSLVAQVDVPWHEQGVAVASLDKPLGKVRAPVSPSPRPAVAMMVAENASSAVTAKQPIPRPGAVMLADAATSAAITHPAPAEKSSAAVVRTAANIPRPSMRPSIDAGASIAGGEGDTDLPIQQPGQNWTVQIGAYAERSQASAQLASYAHKARGMLASATRIIDPVQSPGGHTLYRARFGLFPERQARQVCSRLTERGQTCFAAIQAH